MSMRCAACRCWLALVMHADESMFCSDTCSITAWQHHMALSYVPSCMILTSGVASLVTQGS